MSLLLCSGPMQSRFDTRKLINIEIAGRLTRPWAIELCKSLVHGENSRAADFEDKKQRIIQACSDIEEERQTNPYPVGATANALTVVQFSKEIAHDLRLIVSTWPLLPTNFSLALVTYYRRGHSYIAHPTYLNLLVDYGKSNFGSTKVEVELRGALSRMHPYPPLEMQNKTIIPSLMKMPPEMRLGVLKTCAAVNKYQISHKFFEAFVEQLDISRSPDHLKKKVIAALNGAGQEDFNYTLQTFQNVSRNCPQHRRALFQQISEGNLHLLPKWVTQKLSGQKVVANNSDVVNGVAEISSPLSSPEEKIRNEYRRALKEEREGYQERTTEELYDAFTSRSGALVAPAPVDAVDRAFDLLRGIEARRCLYRRSPRVENLRAEIQYYRKQLPQGSDHQKVAYFTAASELFLKHFGEYPYNTQLVATLLFADTKLLESINPKFQYRGSFSEVGTGEGKSLLTALQAGYQASQGQLVDNLTSNNYLAGRDAIRFQEYFQDLGFTSSHFRYADKAGSKAAAADICFSAVDDRIFCVLSSKFHSQSASHRNRRLETAIVDEADLALLPHHNEICRVSNILGEVVPIKILKRCKDFVALHGHKKIQDNLRQAVLDFRNFCAGARSLSDLRVAMYLISTMHHGQLERNKHYIIRDDKTVVVDLGTSGRLLKTQWTNGTNRLIAMKEGLPMPPDSGISGQMSASQLLSRYKRLIGISGSIGDEFERKEVAVTQNLINFDIPRHHPKKLQHDPFSFILKRERWLKKIGEISVKCTQGPTPQAVEFFTDTIEISQELHRTLRPQVARLQLLNDLDNLDEFGNHSDEDSLIKAIGSLGMVTLSTGAGGRGADSRPKPEVLANGGLKIVMTHYPSNLRVQNQEEGRTARQGEVGSAKHLICAETDYFLNYMVASGVKEIILAIAERYRCNSDVMEKTMGFVRELHAIIGCRVRMLVHANQQLIEIVQDNFENSLRKIVSEVTAANSGAFTSKNHAKNFVHGHASKAWSSLFDEYVLIVENQHVLIPKSPWDAHLPVSPYYEKLFNNVFQRARKGTDSYIEGRYVDIVHLYIKHLSILETEHKLLSPVAAKELVSKFLTIWTNWVGEFIQKTSYRSRAELIGLGGTIVDTRLGSLIAPIESTFQRRQ